MKSLLALAAIMLWPVIPLFWIPVHLMTGVDSTVVNAVIMPLEERELLQRFGESYADIWKECRT